MWIGLKALWQAWQTRGGGWWQRVQCQHGSVDWPFSQYRGHLLQGLVTDTPPFRGGNPYFFSENLSQSVSFIYASMYSENVHAIHIAMQFTKNRDIV